MRREAALGSDRAAAAGPWRIWIDTGGTFTDCLALDPDGRAHRAKVLSDGTLRARVEERRTGGELVVTGLGELPAGFLDGCAVRAADTGGSIGRVAGFDAATGRLRLRPRVPDGCGRGDRLEILTGEEAPVLAARQVTATPRGAPLPTLEMRLATTRGTNALLERNGSPTALFITRGFGDLLEIGTQQRPDLFALEVRKPAPLYARVVEVDERLDAAGRVLRPLCTEALEQQVTDLRAAGIEAAAVALLHSYRNPDHEIALADHLRSRGLRHVSCSASLVPQIRLLPRAETAVVDAYLGPPVGDYLEAVGRQVGAATLHVMTSAGGLHRAADFRPKDSLLSGPAGGVVGAAEAGRRSGVERVIAFDMGGTSTDVSRFDGEFDYRYETEVGGVRLLAPALAIETVAAGGGSICRFEAQRFRVGPESSGADPGPACYGAGGPLCLTDVNLLLGRLAPERFGIPIDSAAAAAAADRLMEAAGAVRGAREAALSGLLEIADERMAEAVRQISVRRGYDPSEYVLVAFGGAGPQHACNLARLLGMPRVVVPPDASLLSALGLGAATVERFVQRQVLQPLDEVTGRLDVWADDLGREAVGQVAAEGVPRSGIEIRLRQAELRLLGQDTGLPIDFRSASELAPAFRRAYRELYGYSPPRRAIEVDLLRVTASSRRGEVARPEGSPPPRGVEPTGQTRSWFGGAWRPTAVYLRPTLAPGAAFEGPALVVEAHTCTVVEPGWQGAVDAAGALCLHHRARDADE